MDDILARLEHAKKTIIDLEKKKLDLTQEERRLKELYDEEELKYKTTVSYSATQETNTLDKINVSSSWTLRGRRLTT